MGYYNMRACFVGCAPGARVAGLWLAYYEAADGGRLMGYGAGAGVMGIERGKGVRDF